MAKFVKGQIANPKGRPPGPNKLTVSVKEAFQDAFTKLQHEPGVNLAEWGRENPTQFYVLASKLIPTELKADVGANLMNLLANLGKAQPRLTDQGKQAISEVAQAMIEEDGGNSGGNSGSV